MAATPGSAVAELSCPICYELFVDPHTPKSLPCGHVLCKVCLRQMIKGKCQKVCPECRQKITIPYDGIAAFTTIYRLRSLAENHQVVGGNLPKMSPKKSGACICPDHEDEKMHYYCITCCTFACQACLILKHNGTEHRIEGAKEMCRKQRMEMKSAIIKGKSKFTAAESTLCELKMAEVKTRKFYENLEKQIDKCAESQMNEIFTESERLKRQVERAKQMSMGDLKRETATVQKHIHSAQESYRDAVSASENLSDHEYLTQHALLINKMEEIYISKPTTLSKTKQDVIKFVPNSSQIKLGQIVSVTHGVQGRSPEYLTQNDLLVNKMEEIHISKPTTLASKTEQDINRSLPNSSQSKLGHISVTHGVQVRTPIKIQTLYGFSYAGSVDCRSDGLLAIADFDGKKVVFYQKVNNKYEWKLDLKLSTVNQYAPYDIAISPDGRFMVARRICIEVYSPDGYHQHDIKIKGSDEVDVDRVQVTSHGRIVVADYNRSLLMGINPTGIIKGTIHTSIKPEDMILIHDTHIAISDREAGKVVVIHIESGQETLSFDITNVLGICYDEHTEFLLIARSEPANEPNSVLADTGVIEQYSYTTGKLIACLQQGLYYPQKIALTSDGHLIVVNERTVGIYKV